MYNHDKDNLYDACGIGIDRMKTIFKEFSNKIKSDGIYCKDAPPTSYIFEMIDQMDWSITEKMYMVFKYGEFIEHTSSLIAAKTVLSEILNDITTGGISEKKGTSVSDWNNTKTWKEK